MNLSGANKKKNHKKSLLVVYFEIRVFFISPVMKVCKQHFFFAVIPSLAPSQGAVKIFDIAEYQIFFKSFLIKFVYEIILAIRFEIESNLQTTKVTWFSLNKIKEQKPLLI